MCLYWSKHICTFCCWCNQTLYAPGSKASFSFSYQYSIFNDKLLKNYKDVCMIKRSSFAASNKKIYTGFVRHFSPYVADNKELYIPLPVLEPTPGLEPPPPGLNCMGKEKNVLYFRSTTLHVLPCKLSIFTNLNFENSFIILIWLAKNQEQPIFEYLFVPSWVFLA